MISIHNLHTSLIDWEIEELGIYHNRNYYRENNWNYIWGIECLNNGGSLLQNNQYIFWVKLANKLKVGMIPHRASHKDIEQYYIKYNHL